MTIFQSILLGIVQGLTEFLPISSSAHLVLLPYFLGWEIPISQAFIFDVLVQVATLLGVVAYFWSDLTMIASAVVKSLWRRQPLADPQSRLGWFILLACLPAGVIGLAVKDLVEKTFDSPLATAFFLFGTACLMVVAEIQGKRIRDFEQIKWFDALWIGFFQALAIFPGLSRSGATISGGMLRNLDRPSAARFSFLLSVPILLAAGAVVLPDLIKLPDLGSVLPAFIPGFIAAAVVGYLSIRWLLGYLARRSLYIFAIYCTGLALTTLVVFFVRG
ncbi:MAG: undecaprenyl-diphosphatase UppP [Chloroflexi bacterium RBG_16_52_11]|nr:MAG: undecaprenyl-diphosphatase UppP [Chloroflexi bacterium RBG_16_52_11]